MRAIENEQVGSLAPFSAYVGSEEGFVICVKRVLCVFPTILPSSEELGEVRIGIHESEQRLSLLLLSDVLVVLLDPQLDGLPVSFVYQLAGGGDDELMKCNARKTRLVVT